MQQVGLLFLRFFVFFDFRVRVNHPRERQGVALLSKKYVLILESNVSFDVLNRDLDLLS